VCESGPGFFFALVATLLFLAASIVEWIGPRAEPLWSLGDGDTDDTMDSETNSKKARKDDEEKENETRYHFDDDYDEYKDEKDHIPVQSFDEDLFPEDD
jgi:hypothetical protein